MQDVKKFVESWTQEKAIRAEWFTSGLAVLGTQSTVPVQADQCLYALVFVALIDRFRTLQWKISSMTSRNAQQRLKTLESCKVIKSLFCSSIAP